MISCGVLDEEKDDVCQVQMKMLNPLHQKTKRCVCLSLSENIENFEVLFVVKALEGRRVHEFASAELLGLPSSEELALQFLGGQELPGQQQNPDVCNAK